MAVAKRNARSRAFGTGPIRLAATRKTFCAASSTSPSATPSRRSERHTNACSRITTSRSRAEVGGACGAASAGAGSVDSESIAMGMEACDTSASRDLSGRARFRSRKTQAHTQRDSKAYGSELVCARISYEKRASPERNDRVDHGLDEERPSDPSPAPELRAQGAEAILGQFGPPHGVGLGLESPCLAAEARTQGQAFSDRKSVV